MNDDERMVEALRVALDERAALIEPGDRLDEILRTARSSRSPWSTSWWLPLAAAAAVLAVVAGAWFGLPDGSEPIPAGSDLPLPTSSPLTSPLRRPHDEPVRRTHRQRRTVAHEHRLDPGRRLTAGTPVALPVYYVATIGDDARMARLYREWLTVPGVTRQADDRLRARTAVELAMTAEPPGTDGYLRTWDGVELVDVAVTDARITITLSGPGGTAFPEDTERVSVQQLVWTAQAAVGRGTIPVRFVLADGSEAIFGTQPVDRTYNRPASRDLYHEDLAPIWVNSPTRGQELGSGPVTVTGEASVFEATVSWQLLREGDVLDEGFVTASDGAPGRGTYEIDLGTLSPGAYAIRVYEQSAEDGQRSRPRRRCPSRCGEPGTQRQRAIALSTARAAGPAVEDRSTVPPRRTTDAPADARAASSSGATPPSGPTTSTTSPAAGSETLARGIRASSCNTYAAAAPRTRTASSAVVAVAASTGRRVRRDCFVAARRTASHLRRAFSPRSPRHWTTLRDACHGTTSSTPHSVAASTACSSRSYLARAWTRTNRGLGRGSVVTETTSRSSDPAPTATTRASTRFPSPSVSRSRSPTRVRRTVAACRPSGPSRTTTSPTPRPVSVSPVSRWSGRVMAVVSGP